MQLSTNEDIEAPIEYVFAAITDFDGFAKQAMRRGAEVTRMDTLTEVGEGMIWQTGFDFRGKRRDMRIELTELDKPNRVCAHNTLPGMTGSLVLDLVALSRQRTRLSIDLQLSPQSLSSRLLVQSLKLARGNLTKRLGKRLTEFSRQTEENYQRTS